MMIVVLGGIGILKEPKVTKDIMGLLQTEWVNFSHFCPRNTKIKPFRWKYNCLGCRLKNPLPFAVKGEIAKPKFP